MSLSATPTGVVDVLTVDDWLIETSSLVRVHLDARLHADAPPLTEICEAVAPLPRPPRGGRTGRARRPAPADAAGRETARALGARLAADGVRADAVLSSPLLRARETAAELGRALGCEPEADERLAPGATADDVRDVVAGRGDEVVVVGHQPDCGEIAAELERRAAAGVPAGRPRRARAVDSPRAGDQRHRPAQVVRRLRGGARHRLRDRGRRGVRPARPERRRQDDDRRDPRGLPDARRRARSRCSDEDPAARRARLARAHRRRAPVVGACTRT